MTLSVLKTSLPMQRGHNTLSICLSVCLTICLSVCLSNYLAVSLSICLSVCLSVVSVGCIKDVSICNQYKLNKNSKIPGRFHTTAISLKKENFTNF